MNLHPQSLFLCSSLALVLSASMLHAANDAEPADIQRFMAIDNVCAWPNLTLLPDGTINATIFGRPSHGQMPGAVECWNSANGEFWTKRGVPAPNDDHTNRMNVAAGLAKNGDLLVLCSGWTDAAQPPRPKQAAYRDDILSTWVCRSSDGGIHWTQNKVFPAPDLGWTNYIPFGDVKVGEDGALHVSCYGGEFVDPNTSTKTRGYRSWHFRSDDDGLTWNRVSTIHPTGNETTLLHLGGKRWMAAARQTGMDIFVSADDGVTWSEPTRVTQNNEINGHLARLKDGRILLTYGSRIRTDDQLGVLAKFSNDEGKTWSTSTRIAYTTTGDCGYPSTVQRADGKLVTAWYSGSSRDHARYHMGVAIWSPPAL